MIWYEHISIRVLISMFLCFKFWGAEKETQQRLESAIFEDLNRYCWNQQNSGNISISSATTNSSTNNSGPQVINNSDGQVLILHNTCFIDGDLNLAFFHARYFIWSQFEFHSKPFSIFLPLLNRFTR